MTSLKKALLVENPDAILDSQGNLITSAYLTEAYPFGIWKGKLYIGNIRTAHYEIIDAEAKRRRKPTDGLNQILDIADALRAEGFPHRRSHWTYPGRFWSDLKIISFWQYPSRSEFLEIINELEKNTSLKIWNNGWRLDYKEELLPVEEYKREVPTKKTADFYGEHPKSPLLKSFKPVPQGIGSKKNRGALPAKTNFYTKLDEATLSEVADEITLDGEEAKKIGRVGETKLYFANREARAFLYDNEGEIAVSDPGDTHGWTRSKRGYSLGLAGTKRGRIWLDSKVISFWNYPPTQSDLKKIVGDLETELKIQIWNKGWYIEEPGTSYGENSTLLPLEDYLRPSASDPEYHQHETPPILKKQREVPPGVGSKKHRGTLPARTNYQYTTNIAEMLLKESPDSFTDPVDGQLVAFDTGDSFPFIYFPTHDVLLTGRRQGSHFYVWRALEQGYKAGEYDFNRDDLELDEIIDGRVWTDRKVFSFWNTPDSEDMLRLVVLLEKALRIGIFGNKYRVESGWNRRKGHNDMRPLESFLPGGHRLWQSKQIELPPDRFVPKPPPKTRVKGKPVQAKGEFYKNLYR